MSQQKAVHGGLSLPSPRQMVAAILTDTGRMIAGQSQTRRNPTAHQGNRAKQSNANLWRTPISERPAVPYDKGVVAQLLENIQALREDSPAAAVALLDTLTLLVGDHSWQARSRLTAELQRAIPTDGGWQSIQAGLAEARQSGLRQQYSTAELSKQEFRYLQFIHGMRFLDLRQFAGTLKPLAEKLEMEDSQHRQASARVILAAVYLRLRRFEDFQEQMEIAGLIFAQIHGAKELQAMARGATRTAPSSAKAHA